MNKNTGYCLSSMQAFVALQAETQKTKLLSYNPGESCLDDILKQIDRVYDTKTPLISIATIIPADICKYNNRDREKTNPQNRSYEQIRLEQDLETVNTRLQHLNKSRGITSIRAHAQVYVGQVLKGNKHKRILKCAAKHLYDGVHHDQELKKKLF